MDANWRLRYRRCDPGFNSRYLSIFVTIFASQIIKGEFGFAALDYRIRIFVFVVALGPIVGMPWLTRGVLRHWTIACTVELFKDPHEVVKVARKQRTRQVRRLRRYFILYYFGTNSRVFLDPAPPPRTAPHAPCGVLYVRVVPISTGC